MEIAFRVSHQLARESAKVGHLTSVLGRNGEPEMMAVLLAPRSESLCIGVVGSPIEHPRFDSIAGDALALEIGEVLGQRR